MLSSLARLLRLFAASIVPGGGYFLAGWSPSTTLALYWVDTLVGTFAMAMRIDLHRRWTGMAGHGRAHLNTTVTTTSGGETRTTKFRSFLAEFLFTSLAFTLAHGIFLAAILGFMLEPPNLEDAKKGAIGILACHGLSLGLDTFRLDTWPFARLKQMTEKLMGRVFVVHLAIIGGMFYMAWRDTPGAFFGVFIWLKALTDIGSILPQWNPRDPPRWLVKTMGVFPKQKGETFEEYWRRTEKQTEKQAAKDEERVGAER
jgi:Family of unknown function (DUF6498)